MKKRSFFDGIVKINDVVGQIERFFSVVVLLLLIVACMIFITCRYFIHVSTPWSDELACFVLVALGWIGASYCCYHDDHLRINALSSLVKKYCKSSQKILAVVEMITQIIICVFMAFFLYNFTRYLTQSVIPLHVLTVSLKIPSHYPMMSVAVGSALMIFHAFMKTLIILGQLPGKLPFPEAAAVEE